MRVAITNVMEATLESAFQLILQLYIVGTQYEDLTKVGSKVCFVIYKNLYGVVYFITNLIYKI